MLVSVIAEKTLADMKSQFDTIKAVTDAIELRLDYLTTIDYHALQSFRVEIDCPVIFTLRKSSQGGRYALSEQKRVLDIKKLLQLQPDYFDLESDMDPDSIASIKHEFPQANIILSYHNFEETPDNLSEILKHMRQQDCAIYKIVTFAQNSIDTLKMMHFVKRNSSDMKLVGHCMGEFGVASRICGPILGNYLHYANASTASPAPGSLDTQTLLDTYHFKNINRDTKMYALLGDPVEQSIGHQLHNQRFEKYHYNAVYLKLRLRQAELADFFKHIKGLPFKGFSVTMPLKEVIMDYMDVIEKDAQHIGAVNTVRIEKGHYFATNTDAPGALDAIEDKMRIRGKTVFIMGAGGAAKAIAYEAKKRGANLTIVNRGLEKAKALADKVSGYAYNFETFKKVSDPAFDILINTLPQSQVVIEHFEDQLDRCLSAETLVMDIVYHPKETALLKKAKTFNCQLVYGEDMFLRQAEYQFHYLLNKVNNETEVAYQIVGEDEADIKAGKISIVSPIARSLIGKEEGDVVGVKTPQGMVEYEIIAVDHR